MEPPPTSLICLAERPRESWIGTTVYHPMTQWNGVPYWRESDMPSDMPGVDPDEPRSSEYVYDVGVVESVHVDPLGGYRCRFRLPGGGTLRYGADNLWTVPAAAELPESPAR